MLFRSEFSSYAKKANNGSSSSESRHFVTALRKLTQPYILRRLKSDKSIISDLPDKTEMKTYCALSKEQVQHYQATIDELAQKLETA